MLRPATAADFGFIRALAQRPENAPFITDEDEVALARYVADPASRLYIWDEAGQAAGFALYCQMDEPSGAVELRRLALAETGGGRGLAFVKALTDHGFAELGAKRVWLDASGENPRAARVYEKAGYKLEGVLRQHWWRPALGRTVDLLLFGLLREEWQR
jgi:RimJ/RimL family protein N-acetyltransferase